MSALAMASFAQQTRDIAPIKMQPAADDPVIMTIDGTPVLRSEFEYSYNKNNNQAVIDKKKVDEYVPLFVNYKLKVREALSQQLDTASSFINEFLSYRDGQVKPSFVTDADVEAKARQIYQQAKQSADQTGGLYNWAHIYFSTPQAMSAEASEAIKAKADSLHDVLKRGESTFEDLAARYSDDTQSKARGGELGWVQKGSFIPEFENVAIKLKEGEISQVTKSPTGYHIIKLIGRRDFFEYDSVRSEIMKFIEARDLRSAIADEVIARKAAEDSTQTIETVVDRRAVELQNADADTRNLIREYYEGLLLYEISNKQVWEKASKDEAGQEAFFLANRKNYTWDEPRYKGMVYHVKDKAAEKAVKKTVKSLPFEQWAETLRTTFNKDSVIRVRVELGRFKPGDNEWVDKKAFKKNSQPKTNDTFHTEGIFGKLIKAPENHYDVKNEVLSDYQEYLEEQWVELLKAKYEVEIRQDVLQTVNNH